VLRQLALAAQRLDHVEAEDVRLPLLERAGFDDLRAAARLGHTQAAALLSRGARMMIVRPA
jgi:hypothetical protein